MCINALFHIHRKVNISLERINNLYLLQRGSKCVIIEKIITKFLHMVLNNLLRERKNELEK